MGLREKNRKRQQQHQQQNQQKWDNILPSKHAERERKKKRVLFYGLGLAPQRWSKGDNAKTKQTTNNPSYNSFFLFLVRWAVFLCILFQFSSHASGIVAINAIFTACTKPMLL